MSSINNITTFDHYLQTCTSWMLSVNVIFKQQHEELAKLTTIGCIGWYAIKPVSLSPIKVYMVVYQ